ncbi:MAG: ADP-ribosylglycohydrolase family protein, partial [Gammaproteobacteria bacterium]|nr:ADP-ribosylglycohydrolase family protein [Gammaproteobacteria bacterium]
MQSLEPVRQRALAALKNAFVADALAMPVHWYYNPMDIVREFPDGITRFEAAPAFHPSSIMSLHSTRQGGRQHAQGAGAKREIVGDVILKGKRQHWGQSNRHYHHGMEAGQNTLNAHCARVLIRALAVNAGRYDKDRFIADYIDFMTADSPRHPDTYAESYHRGFFANLEQGKPAHQCGAVTHDTASIGGLVTIAPLVFSESLQGIPLKTVQEHCVEHLMLTHPDKSLAAVCRSYVSLLDDLSNSHDFSEARELLADCVRSSMGINLPALVKSSRCVFDVIGGRFSPACFISGSWPAVLYLGYRYLENPRQGLTANA